MESRGFEHSELNTFWYRASEGLEAEGLSLWISADFRLNIDLEQDEGPYVVRARPARDGEASNLTTLAKPVQPRPLCLQHVSPGWLEAGSARPFASFSCTARPPVKRLDAVRRAWAPSEVPSGRAIVFKPTSGLCNNLIGLASAAVLAAASCRR